MKLSLNLPQKPGFFITATDTEVGKTVIACALAKMFTDAGYKVGPFKPIATGCKRVWEGLVSEDAQFLANSANSDLELGTINPIAYVTPASPVASSAIENKPLDFSKIPEAYKKITDTVDLVIVEGIGGVRVPLTIDIDLIDLAVEFHLPVIIVARPNLGTINHTLMTIDCLRSANLKIAGVIINGYDYTKSQYPDAENTAPQIIAECGDVDILANVPYDEQLDLQYPDSLDHIITTLQSCDFKAAARL